MQRVGLRETKIGNAVLGVSVVVVVVVMLVVLGILYMRPPAQKTFAFETTDVSAITTGQDVRVAGISVGKVQSVDMESQRVRVTARIDADIDIGDRSRVEVRMLTPVGGYAVTLIPLGSTPLTGSIPSDHVTVPYSIGDVLQSAPTVTDEVDGADINAGLHQVAQALTDNPTSLRSIVGGMNAISGILDRQRGQVHRIAGLASEYMQTFNGNREFVFSLITKIDQVVAAYNNSSVGFNRTYWLLADVFGKLTPFLRFYRENSSMVSDNLHRLRDSIASAQQHLDPMLDNLMQMRARLAEWVTPEGMKQLGGGTQWVRGLCVPIAGRDC